MTQLLALLAAAALCACGPNAERSPGLQYAPAPVDGSPPLRLAVHPLHNPQKLAEAYEPLVAHLSRQLPQVRFELEASRDYPAFEAKLRARAPALLLPNPWQTLLAQRSGYRVIAMAGDAEDFKGLILVRRDGPIKSPIDLKGRAMACPAATALAACILPQWLLHSHGLNVRHDLETRYVGSQESSILNVFSGQVTAAATWPPPWRAFQREHPEEAAELKVMWETPPLLNNSVMVRDDVPRALAEAVRAALLALQDSADGRAVLARMETSRFHAANDASYAPVREFIERFEREVRTVELP